jgi:multiple sugar transport system ATP-binding protein
MGDRICVMKDGHIMQVAEPLALYNHPNNLFVAGFIGSPPMNFFRGTIERFGDRLGFVESNFQGTPMRIPLTDELAQKAGRHLARPVVFGIRPEDVSEALTVSDSNADHTIAVKVEFSEPMGAETLLYLTTGAHSFIARVRPTSRFAPDQVVPVTCNLANAHFFDASTEEVLK